MAAALTLPTNVVTGNSLNVTGTGFAATHAYTMQVTGPGRRSPSVTASGVTTAGGAIDATNSCSIICNGEGNMNVVVNDGTSIVTGSVRVWRT